MSAKSKYSLIVLTLCFCVNIGFAQSNQPPYSFFIAGHVYGGPGANNIGVHPPFKSYFGEIQSYPDISFGFFLGDIAAGNPTLQDWEEIDADVESLGLPVYFAAGNHDMRDRELYEERYGQTYYSFTYANDLFIVLDPNIDQWNISGEQLEFFDTILENEALYADNIFIMFHQLLWRESDNIYSHVKPNSFEGRADEINFWSELVPRIQYVPRNFYFCSGDLGAASWSSDFMYDSFDNITLVASGMGEEIGDNIVFFVVDENKSVDLDLHCLDPDLPFCFEDIESYRISNSSLFNPALLDVKIYPNPVEEQLTISLPSSADGELRVWSLQGELVYSSQWSLSRQIDIPMNQLSQGIYVFDIQTSQMQVRTRISKL